MFYVGSEVGRLRQVILHRPDLELKRLTPDNAADLLFDDVLWVAEAQAEHDAFAAALRARGTKVHYYAELLAETMQIPEARQYVLDRVFDPRRHGPLANDSLRGAVEGLDAASLTRFLIGGITKREILEIVPEPKSIAFHSLDPDGFVLAPLPNLLYQRDTSCWIYGGVSINAMRMQARRPGCARPSATRPCTGGIRCSRPATSRSGTTARTVTPPPSRAATCW
jgi:arginine deiminase